MPRISGINVPDGKRVEYALTAIYGIGLPTAKKIIIATNVKPEIRAKELSSEEIERIQTYIEKNFRVEGDLRLTITDHIRRLTTIGTRRGIRHQKKLPVRGQHTRKNSRTRKGKKQTVATGRKAPAAKT